MADLEATHMAVPPTAVPASSSGASDDHGRGALPGLPALPALPPPPPPPGGAAAPKKGGSMFGSVNVPTFAAPRMSMGAMGGFKFGTSKAAQPVAKADAEEPAASHAAGGESE
jgi:hypothetical protein